jgi:hypothetical protein
MAAHHVDNDTANEPRNYTATWDSNGGLNTALLALYKQGVTGSSPVGSTPSWCHLTMSKRDGLRQREVRQRRVVARVDVARERVPAAAVDLQFRRSALLRCMSV